MGLGINNNTWELYQYSVVLWSLVTKLIYNIVDQNMITGLCKNVLITTFYDGKRHFYRDFFYSGVSWPCFYCHTVPTLKIAIFNEQIIQQ